MAHEYTQFQIAHLGMHEMQTPHYIYNAQLHEHNVVNTAASYQLAAAPIACLNPVPTSSTIYTQNNISCRMNNVLQTFNANDVLNVQYDNNMTIITGSGSMGEPTGSSVSMSSNVSRKRTESSNSGSINEEEIIDDTKSLIVLSEKKHNHSQIEKRRRDKMNTYIMELSSLVPMCRAMSRKLDKLSVLRMAVQHMRSVRGNLTACSIATRPRPTFMTEREMNALILQAAQDCFLFVVSCDGGRLVYVSASVTKMLNYSQNELHGKSVFDIIHPKDVSKVKEQLSSPDLNTRERLVDAKTMLPIKTDVVTDTTSLSPGARRSFFCRIKCKQNGLKQDSACKLRKKQLADKKYCIIYCTGYLKSWTPAELGDVGRGFDGTEDMDMSNTSCLVAVGRALKDLTPRIPEPDTTQAVKQFPSVLKAQMEETNRTRFTSRHTTDGKFLFVDQRVTLAVGFLPQELLGTSLYEYISANEISNVARAHKETLYRRECMATLPYTFRKKNGTTATIQTFFKPFRNPWTKDMECLVADNVVISSETNIFNNVQTPFGMFEGPSIALENNCPLSEADMEMQHLINTHVEYNKVGSAIADDVNGLNTAVSPPELQMTSELPEEMLFDYQQPSLLNSTLNENSKIRNNVSLSVASAISPVREEMVPTSSKSNEEIPVEITAPVTPSRAADGNGEAAMAVIMSLLEAEAGFGGLVDVPSLPWLLHEGV